MSSALREIQAADYLGFTEMAEFRAAVKAGTVPAPSRQLSIRRRTVDVWSRADLDDWIANNGGTEVGSLHELIKAKF
jgi:hypothetical protein